MNGIFAQRKEEQASHKGGGESRKWKVKGGGTRGGLCDQNCVESSRRGTDRKQGDGNDSDTIRFEFGLFEVERRRKIRSGPRGAREIDEGGTNLHEQVHCPEVSVGGHEEEDDTKPNKHVTDWLGGIRFDKLVNGDTDG